MAALALIPASLQVALPARAAEPARAAREPPAAGRLLSNERTFTRSAQPLLPAPIREWSSRSSPTLSHLRLLTPDGFAETYLLLRSSQDADGQLWIELRIPGRPNGRVGWVPRNALGTIVLTHKALIIDEQTLQASFTIDGHSRWSAPVGIGKRSTPTPTGRYVVDEKFAVADDPLYGAYAIGTTDYSVLSEWPHGGVIGIHGTDEPQLIPGHPSHGCIRMRNADVLWLARHLPIGAPIDID